ncbi:MAG: ankyrin repeat domain-containing protein [Bacteroidota bacterium]
MKTILFFVVYVFLFGKAGAQDIFAAARTGDVKRIEALFKINADTVNSKNASGFTPLIIACYRNQAEATKFLLDHKANVNATSPEGPVILGACYKGNLELTTLLINYKADVNARNEAGTTALMYAALSGNVELLKLLLKQGAEKQAEERSGKTALSYAKMNGSKEIIALLSE